jgi:hypothetical protein
VSLFGRLRSWWNKDTLERAEEETRMTPAERDRAEEDFEAGKDDVFLRGHLRAEGEDFERDSEPPRDP